MSKKSLVFTVALLLTGCLNSDKFSALETPNSVTKSTVGATDKQALPSASNPSFYLVKPSDTLYSIAFRFGLDYKKVAQANNISAPYRIYEGQSIALKEASKTPTARPINTKNTVSSSSVASSSTVTKVNNNVNLTSANVNSKTVSEPSSWVWPHSGKIVRTFSPNSADQKGIDISGRIGDSVVAATDGVVVYAGNGLPGYGNLIIIEHQNSLLSAYAFTQKILVAEKQKIQTGEKIATMGKSGDQPGLHFEIRKSGKPVDPVRYLPAR